MTSASVKLTPQGRVSILAQYRHELGWGSDTDLVEYREGSRVIVERRVDMVARIQDMALGARTDSAEQDSAVAELLATRRAETEAEPSEGEERY